VALLSQISPFLTAVIASGRAPHERNVPAFISLEIGFRGIVMDRNLRERKSFAPCDLLQTRISRVLNREIDRQPDSLMTSIWWGKVQESRRPPPSDGLKVRTIGRDERFGSEACDREFPLQGFRTCFHFIDFQAIEIE
jgi:hypothetical protein